MRLIKKVGDCPYSGLGEGVWATVIPRRFAASTALAEHIDLWLQAVTGKFGKSAARLQYLEIVRMRAAENQRTFYTRYGDWFPILCAVVAAALLILPIVKKGARVDSAPVAANLLSEPDTPLQ